MTATDYNATKEFTFTKYRAVAGRGQLAMYIYTYAVNPRRIKIVLFLNINAEPKFLILLRELKPSMKWGYMST